VSATALFVIFWNWQPYIKAIPFWMLNHLLNLKYVYFIHSCKNVHCMMLRDQSILMQGRGPEDI